MPVSDKDLEEIIARMDKHKSPLSLTIIGICKELLERRNELAPNETTMAEVSEWFTDRLSDEH